MTRESAKDGRVRWRLFFSEVIGTAALVCGGLSIVIVMSGDGRIVLGGGNVARLKNLPPGCRAGSNDNAFLGGFRLW